MSDLVRDSYPKIETLFERWIGPSVRQATAFVPGLRRFLGLAPIALIDGAVIGAAALVPFVVNEASKPRARRTGSKQ